MTTPPLPKLPVSEAAKAPELPKLPELPAVDAPKAPELPSVKDVSTVDAPPALEALPDVAATGEQPTPAPDAEVPALPDAAPLPPEPAAEEPVKADAKPAPKKEEKGFLSGLTGQVASMLGKNEPKPVDADALPPMPALPEDGAAPALPEVPAPDAAPLKPEASAEPDAAPLEDVAAATPPSLPGLPALPKEDVNEVPVATQATKTLPRLDAITTDKSRSKSVKMEDAPKADEAAPAELTLADAAPPAAASSEKKPLPSLKAIGSKANAKEELPPLPELTPIDEVKEEAPKADAPKAEEAKAEEPKVVEPVKAEAPKVDAPKEEKKPAKPMAPAADKLPVANSNEPSPSSVKPPALTFDQLGRKFVRLEFARNEEEVTEAMSPPLQELVQYMQENPSTQLMVTSRAGSNIDDSSIARRVSLRRALAVRSFFMDKGIATDRVSVDALGNSSLDNASQERVDIRVQ